MVDAVAAFLLVNADHGMRRGSRSTRHELAAGQFTVSYFAEAVSESIDAC